MHARPGIIPGDTPTAIITLQKGYRRGSDIFYGLHHMRSDDLGATWTQPMPHESLARRALEGGMEEAVSDVTPGWHEASETFLGIGHTVRYLGDRIPKERSRQTAYSIFDPATDSWVPWRYLEMPDEPRFQNCGAGCSQWIEREDGDLLVPVYFRARDAKYASATVLRCGFDGDRMEFLEHGSVMSQNTARGLGEPSITRYGDRYYLTIRHDDAGYVTRGDGLFFEPIRKWTFDDGSNLSTYNTQSHWITHSDGLFLVYTRRADTNDHVFRHRAPLYMAQVDPDRLCVIRDTEQIVIPERGARLGNFGTVNVTPDESWVVASEWMQPVGCEEHGSDNAVFVGRVLWKTPNNDA